MKDYLVGNIRNVAILGNNGCGKTTLVEAMAFNSTLISKLGTIQDGNTISDFDKEEIKSQFSLSTSIIPMEWDGYKINVFDTPGQFELVGEREEALRAADSAVIVVNGKYGVEPGTQRAWRLCDKYNLPRLVFVTAMDDDDASYREVIQKLTELYGNKIAPFHQPIRENGKFVGYVNITKMNARRFTGIAKYEEIDIPEYSYENLEKFREGLIESVASTSDDLMEEYFNNQEFTQEEIDEALKVNCCQGTIVPVTMGSGLNVNGVFMLLNDIVRFLPSPCRVKTGINVENNDIFEGTFKRNGPFVAQVVKTISDPCMGEYSIIKLYCGTLSVDNNIYNAAKNIEGKVPKLYMIRGKELVEVKQICAGDIGAIAKFTNTVTGDTLSTKSVPIICDTLSFTKPYTYMRYSVPNREDNDKVATALAKLIEEDVTLKVINDKENGQLLIYGIGDHHLELAVSKLLNKYDVQIDLSKPKFAYKDAYTSLGPILLEPIGTIVIHSPDQFTKDIICDLNKRRGSVLGMSLDENDIQIIAADIPMSELFGYSTKLCLMTGGLGEFSYEFARYEQAPDEVFKKLTEERSTNVDKLDS